jgi:hypothetical protein
MFHTTKGEQNLTCSVQIGRQIDQQMRVLELLFGGGAAESYERFLVEICSPISTCVLDVGAIRDTPVPKTDVILVIFSG